MRLYLIAAWVRRVDLNDCRAVSHGNNRGISVRLFRRFSRVGAMFVMVSFHGGVLDDKRPWRRGQSKTGGGQDDAGDHHDFSSDTALKAPAGARTALSEGRCQTLPIDGR